MSKQRKITVGPDIPDDVVLLDSQGREVDDAYVDAAVEEALAVARRGRPSLSRSGESPLLRVRVSNELNEALTTAAEQAGTSRAEWVRRVLSDAVKRAS